MGCLFLLAGVSCAFAEISRRKNGSHGESLFHDIGEYALFLFSTVAILHGIGFFTMFS